MPPTNLQDVPGNEPRSNSRGSLEIGETPRQTAISSDLVFSGLTLYELVANLQDAAKIRAAAEAAEHKRLAIVAARPFRYELRRAQFANDFKLGGES